jgi:hypothetical protein
MCIVLALLYRFICARENKKRDNSGIAEAFENAYDDDMTDVKNKQFRYIRASIFAHGFAGY